MPNGDTIVANGGWQFNRGLDDAFIDALAELAMKPSWFKDVLADPDLFIGIRDNYFNVYSKGQSLFMAVWRPNKTITVTTHIKYLVDPRLDQQIKLSDGKFDIAVVKEPIADRYEGAATLKRMKAAAVYYRGVEKTGLHEIIKHNPHIIDLEVALSKAADQEGTGGEPKRATAPRIDVACLKDYENADLWSTKTPPVVAQVEEYRDLVLKYKENMRKSYQRVAQNLETIARWAEGREKISQLIVDVANGKELVVDEPVNIGVIVFGYNQAQANGTRHRSMCDKIADARLSLAKIGNPKGFKLPSARYQ